MPVGAATGLDDDSVVDCDDVTTVAPDDVLEQIGFLSDADDLALMRALLAADDVVLPPRRTGPPTPRS